MTDLPVYTLVHMLTMVALGVVIGGCLGAAWTTWLMQRRYAMIPRDAFKQPGIVIPIRPTSTPLAEMLQHGTDLEGS